MTDSEYQEAQDVLMLIGEMAERFDWNTFRERISNAESVGAVFEPTLYRAASGRLKLIHLMAGDAIRISGSYHDLNLQVNDEIHSREREQ